MAMDSQRGEPPVTMDFLVSIGTSYAIDVRGKRYHFETPANCGLVVVNADGQHSKDPGPRDHLWRAVECWRRQGRRLVNGVCVWDEPPMRRLKHLGGKQWRECAPGERADRLIPGDHEEAPQ
jgi:hypothetical protein